MGAPAATAKRDLSALMRSGILETRRRRRAVGYELSAQIVSRKVSRKDGGEEGKNA
jgi:hypothetical protein